MTDLSAVVEASEYVQASWSTYEQMREARDQANGRADVAERELAEANASIAKALDLIENSDHSCCPCVEPDCSVCGVCRARIELGGSL